MDEQAIASSLENLPGNIQAFKAIAEALDEITSNEELSLHCIHDYHSFNHNGETFANLLYAHYADGDYRDAILMFDIAAQKASSLQDGRPLETGNIELARANIGGCVSTVDHRAMEWWQEETMCLVNNLTSLTSATRRLFIKMNLLTEQLERLSSIMFPNVHFHADIDSLKRMGLSYRDHTETIIDHLSYLNDHATIDFSNDLPAHIIQLAASKGIDISPESPNTHANAQAMSRRKIDINGTPLVCEWHSKITYNKGRIHFHARPSTHHENILKVSKSKVIVGIIAEHLPT
ncbi:hypothetical protein ACIOVF_26275 [Pseudomonas sp. NPDC087612]|uniref:hypothetical protein n=1 Tax=Pseudomonas sp. NPDC087612 TaxID=3364441 RepID=UPI00382F7CD1